VTFARKAGFGAVAAVVASLALVPAASASTDDGLCLGANPRFDPSAEQALRGLTNSFRANAGLKPLRAKGALTVAARRHTWEMAADGLFQHSNTSGSFPWAGKHAAGENLALADTAQDAMWLLTQSPTHRHTLLGRVYTHIGIGAMRTCTGSLLVTQDFLG
jgi:uncharacterized protein YkwD